MPADFVLGASGRFVRLVRDEANIRSDVVNLLDSTASLCSEYVERTLKPLEHS